MFSCRPHCDCFMLRAQQIKIKAPNNDSDSLCKNKLDDNNNNNISGGIGERARARGHQAKREYATTQKQMMKMLIFRKEKKGAKKCRLQNEQKNAKTNEMVTNLPEKRLLLSGLLGTCVPFCGSQRVANEPIVDACCDIFEYTMFLVRLKFV